MEEINDNWSQIKFKHKGRQCTFLVPTEEAKKYNTRAKIDSLKQMVDWYQIGYPTNCNC